MKPLTQSSRLEKGDWVAYHSSEVMGYDYEVSGPEFCFWSRKPLSVLQQAIDGQAWVISGKKRGATTQYEFVGRFCPSKVEAKDDYVTISGEGDELSPPLDITNKPWFREFLREQGNFGLGFNRIRSKSVVRHFSKLLKQQSPKGVSKPAVVAVGSDFKEGKSSQVILSRVERNAQARRRCIEHYGFQCAVCDFDFGKSYGTRGEGFIQVHHLKPLATVGREQNIDPVTDLRPVCPNCHAMIHRKNPMPSIGQLKAIMKKAGRKLSS